MSRVDVSGPRSLLQDQEGAYQATAFFLGATSPVTFTWSNGAISPTALYSWSTMGVHSVVVTATSSCDLVRGVLAVQVLGPFQAYLPLLEKGTNP